MGCVRERPRLRTRDDCRYCGSRDLREVLDLGDQPPSNSFIAPEALGRERRYPLVLHVCGSCWLSQLRHVVPGEEIFDDYAYLSSTSRALVRHYGDLVRALEAAYAPPDGALVVDVGCNDGVLLAQWPERLVRVGVEPSQVAQHARARGLQVVRAFFEPDVARDLVAAHGAARIVTATNVYAHVDDIGGFTDGVAALLDDAGVFVLEVSYLPDLIDGRLFDTIYHEHLCYCAVTPMVPFMARHGLDVIDAERVPFGASGPAIRVTAARTGTRPVSARVAELLAYERSWGLADMRRYARFAKDACAVRDRIVAVVDGLRARGARVAAFGAPAKGNTLLNFLGARPGWIEFVADNTPLKVGKLTPGTHLPVVDDATLLREMPEYALLLAWNYAEHFLANSEYVKRGGRFLVPLPEPVIAP